MTKQKMTMDFHDQLCDFNKTLMKTNHFYKIFMSCTVCFYLGGLFSNDKNVKPVSHSILKISFLTLFGCAVKITLNINPIYG